jgi:protein-tyrosine phosphatase
MDKSNYDDVLAYKKMIKKRESSIILNELFPNENVDVPDPFMAWQMALKWYTTCYDACTIIAEKLISKYA